MNAVDAPSKLPIKTMQPVWWVFLLAWLSCAVYLSTLSGQQIPAVPLRIALGLPNIDKFFHIFFYTMLGISLRAGFSPRVRWFVIFALGTGVALADEGLQSLYRSPGNEDVFDFLVDLSGILIGLVIWSQVQRIAEKKPKLFLRLSALAAALMTGSLGFLTGYAWR